MNEKYFIAVDNLVFRESLSLDSKIIRNAKINEIVHILDLKCINTIVVTWFWVGYVLVRVLLI